jgi:proton-dependent oligopeptide transporter, POT family
MKSVTLGDIQNFKGRYPKQLWFLFFTEMWERFCFYGMRGILTIFMVGQLHITDKDANLKYGAIQAFVYAFTFIGGIFADKILGFKKSLLFGGLVMIAGNLIIAFSPQNYFYLGITFSIIGTGFFKPNISTMVGDLYKEDDVRRDAGFSLFYSGINLGALFGGILCVYLGKYVSWSSAFLAAAIVMIIGLVTFLFTKKYLGPIGDSPLKDMEINKKRIREIAVYAGSMIIVPVILMMVKNTDYTDLFMYIIGPVSVIYFIWETLKLKTTKERNQLIAAFIFIIFSIIFWAFFEQSGGSLSLFAEKNLTKNVLNIPMDPNMVNNSSNSLFVIVFSFLVGLVWLWLARRKLEPNTVVKFGIAFLFLSVGFYIFYYTRFFADANGVTSLNLFTFAWFIITFGELCLSPIGMSIVTKLSPKHLSGMMMGLWFLASAYGQYFAGLLGAGMSTPDNNASLLEKLNAYTSGYKLLSIYALIAGIVLLLISPLVRKLMHEVK